MPVPQEHKRRSTTRCASNVEGLRCPEKQGFKGVKWHVNKTYGWWKKSCTSWLKCSLSHHLQGLGPSQVVSRISSSIKIQLSPWIWNIHVHTWRSPVRDTIGAFVQCGFLTGIHVCWTSHYDPWNLVNFGISSFSGTTTFLFQERKFGTHDRGHWKIDRCKWALKDQDKLLLYYGYNHLIIYYTFPHFFPTEMSTFKRYWQRQIADSQRLEVKAPSGISNRMSGPLNLSI